MQCAYCTFVMADPAGPSCPNCGMTVMAPIYYNGAAPARLSGLATAATTLFICVAAFQVVSTFAGHSGNAKDALAVINALTILALIPVFLTWFYKTRRNAGGWGRQRHGQGWSIGAWFTPIVALWFPYQILADIWRASEPGTSTRRGPDAVAKAWWACWILAWATGISITKTTTTLPDGTTTHNFGFSALLGETIASNIFTAAAAVLGLLVVTKVTRMQEARAMP